MKQLYVVYFVVSMFFSANTFGVIIEDASLHFQQKRDAALRRLGVKSVAEFINLVSNDNDSFYERISFIDEEHIVIVTPSYNNAAWYKWNLDSIFNQNYKNWHLIYLDDNSPDGTGELVKAYVKKRGFEDKVTVIGNTHRRKALANIYTAVQMCKPTDIIAILDGDDRFAFENVLKAVNYMYAVHDVWLTYGQYQEYPTGNIGFCIDYPDEILNRRAYREFASGPSHLRTFYAGLFHKIELADLIYDGDFFPMTYDLAIMFPMLEMASNHFLFCSIPLVDYNVTNPINDHKVSKDLQRRCAKIIRSRERYELIENPF